MFSPNIQKKYFQLNTAVGILPLILQYISLRSSMLIVYHLVLIDFYKVQYISKYPFSITPLPFKIPIYLIVHK